MQTIEFDEARAELLANGINPDAVDGSWPDATPAVETTTDRTGPMDLERFNGTVTLFNPATGGHRTIKIKTKRADATFAPGRRVVELLTGPDTWEMFGFVGAAGWVSVWRSKQGGAFDTYADMLNRPERWAGKVEYMHSVRCRRCGRELTNPTSIESGIGPECATR